MADEKREIELAIRGSLKDFVAEVGRIPGITAKEAKEAAKAFQRAMSKGVKRTMEAHERGAKKAREAWEGFASSVRNVMAIATPVAVVKGFVDFAQSVADVTNEMGDASAATGIAVGSLNAFRAAANASGTELSVILPGLRQFPKRLSDFARGTGEAKNSLEALGFSAADASGMLNDTDGALKEIITRVQGVASAGQRAAMMTEIFGEAGVQLNQVLADVPMEEWITMAESQISVTNESVKAAQRWQAGVSELQNRFTGLIQSFMAAGDAGGNMSQDIMVGLAALMEVAKEAGRVLVDIGGSVGGMWSSIFRGDFQEAANAAAKAQHHLVWSIDDLAVAAERGASEFIVNTTTVLENEAAQAKLAQAISNTEAAQKEAEKAAREHTRQLQKQASAAAKVQSMVESMTDKALTETERIRKDYAGLVAEIDKLREQGLISEANAVNARTALNQQMGVDIADAERATASERASALQKLRDEEARLAQEAMARHDEEMEQKKNDWWGLASEVTAAFSTMMDEMLARSVENFEAEQEQLESLRETRNEANAEATELAERAAAAERQLRASGLNDYKKTRQGMAVAELRRRASDAAARAKDAQDEIATQEAIRDDARNAARRAARASKAASLFEIGVKTAVAVMSAMQLGPIAGPIAAAAVTALGITQAALVASEPLPTFFAGGRVPGTPAGEVPIRAHPNEAILNAGAVDRLGAGIIDALNAGLEPMAALGGGGGGGPVVLDGELVGEVLSRRARRAGPLREALVGQSPVGVVNPFRGN